MREMVGWDHCAGMPGYIEFAHGDGLGSRRPAGSRRGAGSLARGSSHGARAALCTTYCVCVCACTRVRLLADIEVCDSLYVTGLRLID